MKKMLYCAAALASMFFVGSCQQESLEPVGGNTVTYTVQVPEALATRALGDDVTNINTLHYEVYRTAGPETVIFTDADNLLYHKTAPVNNGTATIALELVNDQNYTVLFWAQVGETNEAYEVDNLTNVTVKSGLKANQKDYAAFSGVDFIEADETLAGRTVTLYRPISQINIATTPESLTVFDDDVVLEKSSVTVVGLSNSFNVAKQAAGASMTSTYQFSEWDVPTETLEVNGKAYTYVAMNYVGFADGLGTPVKVSYVINTTEGNIDNDIENVPVKPNYRTNIVGNLITSTSDYTITLEDEWDVPTDEVEIWDGKFISVPAKNDAGVYEVTKPSELAWLAAAVNGTIETKATEAAKTFKGETFVLTENIDLGNFPWTPIGLTGDVAGFQGTFDGNGKTISNLYVDLTAERKYQSAGLFGSISYATIKNFTIKNATIKNLDVIGDSSNGAAVVVGASQFASTIEKVHVVNATVSANKRAAAIAGYMTGTITDCSVEGFVATVTPDQKADGSYDNGDKAGAIMAYDNAGTAINGCSVTDARIEGYRDLGGVAGVARLSITNCTLVNVDIVHNPLNGYKDSVNTFGAIHSGRVTPSGDVTTGNTCTNVNVYAPENVNIVKPGESLQAVVDAVQAPAVIFLAEGTHTGHTSIAKDITLLPLEGASVIYDGHLTLQGGNVVVKDITFTNEHPSSTKVPHDSGNDKHLSCVSAYVANVTLENCTFDIKAQTGYFDYAGSTSVLKNCVFMCNGQRPIQSRSRIEIDGCKFYDQYRYSVQLKGELSGEQVVTFKNNQIINPCVTSGKTFVAGVSVSGSKKCENVTFNISGNTLQSDLFTELYYVYDDSANINMASCTVNGATFVCETEVMETIVVTPENVATTDYTKNAKYALVGDFSSVSTINITPTEGVDLIFDATKATFGSRIKFNIPSVPDNSNVVSRNNGRKGNYTLQNFNGTTIALGAYGTSVAIENSTLDCIDVYAANIALDINGNTIDSEYKMHPRTTDGQETDYAACLMMMAYDLKFDNNVVSNAIGHIVAINGSKATFGTSVPDSANNVESFTGNTITGISGSTKNNRAGFKVWDDMTYAYNGENAFELLPEAGQNLITSIENDKSNVFVKAEGTSNTAYMINFYEYYHKEL